MARLKPGTLRSALVTCGLIGLANVTSAETDDKITAKDNGKTFPSFEWRSSFYSGDKLVSGWHDIPMSRSEGTYTFVCEIPFDSTAKLEMNKWEKHNPIYHDTKKGKLRYKDNYKWNYGYIPQTWDPPNRKSSHVKKEKVIGDNDPLDVCEIGPTTCKIGEIYDVKIFGAVGKIDNKIAEGDANDELDWKLLAIRVDPKNPNAMPTEKQIADLVAHNKKDDTYFTTLGKLHDGAYFDQKQTEEIIAEAHKFWKELMDGKNDYNKGNDEPVEVTRYIDTSTAASKSDDKKELDITDPAFINLVLTLTIILGVIVGLVFLSGMLYYCYSEKKAKEAGFRESDSLVTEA